MALLLRKIRRSRWILPEGARWVPQGEVHADPLGDLITKEGKLSVWVVSEEKRNLERVLAALAGNCDSLQNIDYVLFDEEIVDQIGIRSEQQRGNSPDEEANERWHRDLIELTAGRAAVLARSIYRACEKERRLHKDVKRLLSEALGNGWIDPERLRPSLRQKIME